MDANGVRTIDEIYISQSTLRGGALKGGADFNWEGGADVWGDNNSDELSSISKIVGFWGVAAGSVQLNSQSNLHHRYNYGTKTHSAEQLTKTGLYKDEVVAKNCTPNYLPQYIAIQVAKIGK